MDWLYTGLILLLGFAVLAMAAGCARMKDSK